MERRKKGKKGKRVKDVAGMPDRAIGRRAKEWEGKI
jgi:hypothetical protein